MTDRDTLIQRLRDLRCDARSHGAKPPTQSRRCSTSWQS